MSFIQPPIARDSNAPTFFQPASGSLGDDGRQTKVLSPSGTRPIPFRYGTNWPTIRGYEILSVIGSGGMGVVYKARHRDLLRAVAIKTLRGSYLCEPEFHERFRAEAEAVARLQHPNIIQVFEIGGVEPGPGMAYPSPFIALEYVDGGSLARRTETPQAPKFAARMVEKLARAAHSAHRLGVIHRDLKPSNVLLTGDDEPKIADFGLAKQLEGERDTSGRFVTEVGMILGTPEYMAPEQATGADPTPAFDIYALGVILYELLTGRVPFSAATPLETINLLLCQEPIPPRRLQPDLPRDLETICLKCLEKLPGKRYESAESLADDLDRYLAGRTIHARPATRIERASRWARRNPLPATLIAAVVLVGVAGLSGVIVKWRQAVGHAYDAEVARANAEEHARTERLELYRANIVAAASALQVHNVGSAQRMLEAAPVQYRNWEWGHFHSQLDMARRVLDCPDNPVYPGLIAGDDKRVVVLGHHSLLQVWDLANGQDSKPVTFNRGPLIERQLSPDGRTLAYLDKDNSAVLVDTKTNLVRAKLRGHQAAVHAIRLSADCGRVVTAGHDETVCIWDVQTGELLRSIRLNWAPAAGFYLSPNGRRIAIKREVKENAHIWDLDTGREIAVLTGSDQHHQGVCFNSQGDRFLTVDAYPSNQLRLWDVATGKMLKDMGRMGNTVLQFMFSPDGDRIAACSRDQSIWLCDGRTGDLIATLKNHIGWVVGIDFSPDSTRLVSASRDSTVRLWDGKSGAQLSVMHGHTSDVFSAVFTADGTGIISVSQDKTVRLWDVNAVEHRGRLSGHSTFAYGVAFHPEGQLVASASWDGTARIWDATTGRTMQILNHGDKAIVGSVAFHPDGKILASRDRESIRLWDVATGREIHRWVMASDSWRDSRVVFSKNGDRLATGCDKGDIRIWDVASRAEIAVLRGHKLGVREVAFSPDGKWLASFGDDEDRLVRIWDIERKVQIQTLEGHTNAGYAVAFNGSGTLLASGAIDGTVRLWDTATWKVLAELPHRANVYGVAFSPDGTRLASACADNSIRFWDVATRQEVAQLHGHDCYVHQIAFSPDGTRLASASGDNTLRIWDRRRPQDRGERNR